MRTDNADDVDRQRIVKRNWWYVLFPRVVLFALILVSAWEIVRINVDHSDWPWRLSVLGIGPAAALCGVFGGLLLARGQYARSVRPSLAWSADEGPSTGLRDKAAWTAHLYNAGPGLAIVHDVTYRVEIKGDETTEARGSLVTRAQAIARLEEAGLEEGTDITLRLVTPGAPLPAVNKAADGVEFASLSINAVQKLQSLDFVVQVEDSVGDLHEKRLSFIAIAPPRLRDSATTPAPGDR